MRMGVRKHINVVSEESRCGFQHLDLGINTTRSKQRYALKQLALGFCIIERVSIIIDILICQRY